MNNIKILENGMIKVMGDYRNFYNADNDSIDNTCPVSFENCELLEIDEECIILEPELDWTVTINNITYNKDDFIEDIEERLLKILENIRNGSKEINWSYCPGGKYTNDIIHPFNDVREKSGYKQAYEVTCSKWDDKNNRFIPHLEIKEYPNWNRKSLILEISEQEYLDFLEKAK
jgi:hypothetical protein